MASADSDPYGSPAAQAGARQGEAVLVRAVAAYRAALGSRLIAGYALGSLAHGGFSPLVSDVDLGLILEDRVRLVPLFVHYIDDHIARLRAVGHHRLADRFYRWRTRLLA